MGRRSTGAVTTNEITRLEITHLIKDKVIIKGRNVSGSLTWTSGGSIAFKSVYNADEKYLRVQYTFTDRHTGKKPNMDYKIEIITKPSNLGKGEVLYFLCPSSGLPCRILYLAYGSNIFKSRASYQNTIYYPQQTCSKKDRHNNRYWKLDKQLEELEKLRKTSTYKGKVTKRAIRVQKLEIKRWQADELRWGFESMPVSLQNAMGKNFKF